MYFSENSSSSSSSIPLNKQDRILICINDLENSKAAFRVACNKAATSDLTVELAVSVEDSYSEHGFFAVTRNTMRADRIASAQKIMEECMEIAAQWPLLRIACRTLEKSVFNSLKELLTSDGDAMLMVVDAAVFSDSREDIRIISELCSTIAIPVLVIPDGITDHQISEMCR